MKDLLRLRQWLLNTQAFLFTQVFLVSIFMFWVLFQPLRKGTTNIIIFQRCQLSFFSLFQIIFKTTEHMHEGHGDTSGHRDSWQAVTVYLPILSSSVLFPHYPSPFPSFSAVEWPQDEQRWSDSWLCHLLYVWVIFLRALNLSSPICKMDMTVVRIPLYRILYQVLVSTQ